MLENGSGTHPPHAPHQHVAVKQVLVEGGGGCGAGGAEMVHAVGSPVGSFVGVKGGVDVMGAMDHEIKLVRSLSHPHIVRYLGAHRCGGCLNIMLGASLVVGVQHATPRPLQPTGRLKFITTPQSNTTPPQSTAPTAPCGSSCSAEQHEQLG